MAEASEQTVEQRAEEAKPKPGPLLSFWRGWVRPILTVVIVLSVIRSSLADWNDVPSGSMLPTIQIGDRIVVNKLAYALHAPFTGPKFGIPFTGIQFDNPLQGVPRIASWSSPKRGEIITFWSPKDGTRLVKRVVAIGGDTIEWTREGTLHITDKDGKTLTVEYSDDDFERITGRLESGQPYAFDGQSRTENIDGEARTVQIVTDPQFPYQRPRPFPGAPNLYQPNGVTGPALKPGDTYTVPDDHIWAMGDNRDLSGDSRSFGPVPMKLVTGRVVGVAFSLEGWSPRVSRTFKGLGGPVDK